MPTCYIIPGLAESELSSQTVFPGTIWPAPSALVLGQIGGLRLAANGIDPQPPDGIELAATGPLLPYVGFPALQLQAQMIGQRYRVSVHWYDWRKTILPIGEELAARIRSEVTAGDPCTLVGHSHGGIVSRVAWRSLVLSGDTNLVRRVISLGTAHAGSYAAVGLLSGGNALISGLLSWNQQIGNIAWGALEWVGYRRWTRQELIDLAASWPAIYEVMPVVGAWDSENDPHRGLIFSAANWTGGTVISQPWLTHSREVIAPLMLSLDTRPPGHVMTSVVGTTHATDVGLTSPALLGRSGAIGSDTAGDGTVTVASGTLPGSKQIVTTCLHQDLLPQTVNSGELREWILEERSPSPVPPEPEFDDRPRLPLLTPIPGEVEIRTSAALASNNRCVPGQCGC